MLTQVSCPPAVARPASCNACAVALARAFAAVHHNKTSLPALDPSRRIDRALTARALADTGEGQTPVLPPARLPLLPPAERCTLSCRCHPALGAAGACVRPSCPRLRAWNRNFICAMVASSSNAQRCGPDCRSSARYWNTRDTQARPAPVQRMQEEQQKRSRTASADATTYACMRTW